MFVRNNISCPFCGNKDCVYIFAAERQINDAIGFTLVAHCFVCGVERKSLVPFRILHDLFRTASKALSHRFFGVRPSRWAELKTPFISNKQRKSILALSEEVFPPSLAVNAFTNLCSVDDWLSWQEKFAEHQLYVALIERVLRSSGDPICWPLIPMKWELSPYEWCTLGQALAT